MRKVPPLVFAKVIDGRPAYLLEWQRLPAVQGGGWGARIVWVELDEAGAWFAKGGVVPANQVRQLPGEDYTEVPRDPRPTDPSDPRDLKARQHDHDREYMRQLSGQPPWRNHPAEDDGPF